MSVSYSSLKNTGQYWEQEREEKGKTLLNNHIRLISKATIFPFVGVTLFSDSLLFFSFNLFFDSKYKFYSKYEKGEY